MPLISTCEDRGGNQQTLTQMARKQKHQKMFRKIAKPNVVRKRVKGVKRAQKQLTLPQMWNL